MSPKNYYVVLGVARGESRERSRPELAPEPLSLLGQPEQTRPSYDAFRDRYARNFISRDVPKGEHIESLTLDVVLSAHKAVEGCSIPIGIPTFRSCTECGGTGRVPPFQCAPCGGSGQVEEEGTLHIEVPPGVQAGAILEAPLDMFGIGNLFLRVHVSISAAA